MHTKVILDFDTAPSQQNKGKKLKVHIPSHNFAIDSEFGSQGQISEVGENECLSSPQFLGSGRTENYSSLGKGFSPRSLSAIVKLQINSLLSSEIARSYTTNSPSERNG